MSILKKLLMAFTGGGGTQTWISQAAGTVIGDMTNNDYAFDGNMAKTSGSCASKSGVSAAVGKDWGAGVTKTITGARWTGSIDTGFSYALGASDDVICKVLGHSANDPAAATELYSGTVKDTAGATLEVLTGITPGAYRYHWLQVSGSTSGDIKYFCQAEFAETV